MLLGYLLGLASLATVAAAIAFHGAARDDGQSASNLVDEPSWAKAGTLVGLGCLTEAVAQGLSLKPSSGPRDCSGSRATCVVQTAAGSAGGGACRRRECFG
jgi:hypothetical protein